MTAQLRDRPSGTALVVPLHAVGETVKVGRSGDCDVVIRNGTVSRHHAVLRNDGQEWVVEDLHSKNGTAVNGVPVSEPTPIESGDIVGFGMTAVRFVATEAA